MEGSIIAMIIRKNVEGGENAFEENSYYNSSSSTYAMTVTIINFTIQC